MGEPLVDHCSCGHSSQDHDIPLTWKCQKCTTCMTYTHDGEPAKVVAKPKAFTKAAKKLK